VQKTSDEKNSRGAAPAGSDAFLADLADACANAVRARLGATATDAVDVGLDAAEAVGRLWAGVTVYFRKTPGAGAGAGGAFAARRQEIYDAWRREGVTPAVCRRYGITEQRVRQIAARVLRDRDRRRPTPPAGESGP
jgi:hypothetical protein